jgi:hypothetical protein
MQILRLKSHSPPSRRTAVRKPPEAALVFEVFSSFRNFKLHNKDFSILNFGKSDRENLEVLPVIV